MLTNNLSVLVSNKVLVMIALEEKYMTIHDNPTVAASFQ